MRVCGIDKTFGKAVIHNGDNRTGEGGCVFFFLTVDNRAGEGGWESMVICIKSMLICIKYLLTLIILPNNLTLAVCDDKRIDIDLD